jgi:hypothetical protein
LIGSKQIRGLEQNILGSPCIKFTRPRLKIGLLVNSIRTPTPKVRDFNVKVIAVPVVAGNSPRINSNQTQAKPSQTKPHIRT